MQSSIEKMVEVQVYSLNLRAGQIINAQMRGAGNHLESKFFIYDSFGNLAWESRRKGKKGVVVGEEVSHTGIYYLFIMDDGGNDLDSYGFSIFMNDEHNCAVPLICCETVVHEIDKNAQRNLYRISLKENQKALIRMRSPDIEMESEIYLYDGYGLEIGHYVGARREIEVILDESVHGNSILIACSDLSGNDYGTYGLHFQTLMENHCAGFISCPENVIHDAINHVSEAKSYEIDGIASDQWSFKVTSESPHLEAELRLYDPHGSLVRSSIGRGVVELRGTFAESGTYLLLINDDGGNDTGRFKIEKATPPVSVKLPDCITLYDGYDPLECRSISPTVTGVASTDIHYLWHNGDPASEITVCPEDPATASVMVWTDNQCSYTDTTYVHVIDVRCVDDQEKISLCSMDSLGNTETICVDFNEVESFLRSSGEIKYSLGPCNQQPCSDDPQIITDGLTEENSPELEYVELKKAISLSPTIAQSDLKVNISNSISGKATISILDISGSLTMYTSYTVENNSSISIDVQDLREGLYYLVLINEDERYTEKFMIMR